jgi:hypothetical protein
MKEMKCNGEESLGTSAPYHPYFIFIDKKNPKGDKRPFPITRQYTIIIPLEGAKFLTHDKAESTISIM